MTYGYSMGGYAALKYARMLGISRALGVCPQASIDPVDVPDDKRFHKFHKRGLHDGMMMTASEAPEFGVLMADPYMANDRTSAELFARVGVHWLRTPFMDHATIWLLVETEFLHEVLRLILQAEPVRVIQSPPLTNSAPAIASTLLYSGTFWLGMPAKPLKYRLTSL